MWFFIAEGYHYTHNIKKYAARLFLLAAISHFAYNFCFGIPFIPFQTTAFNQTGVVWSLAWGLVLLYIHDRTPWKPWQKVFITIMRFIFKKRAIIIICLITFPSDWSCIATMAILSIGLYRGDFKKQMAYMMLWTSVYAIVYFLFIDKTYALIQLGTCLTIPLLRLYNGKRGSMKGIGKLFYIYYPLHLFLCGIIRICLWGISFSTGTANF